MSVFITSDEHFNHKNIIGINNRPFKTVTDMNNGIIDNHNTIVEEKDTVIHLGDFVWSGNFYDFVDRLNGYHIFLKGNHDRAYPRTRKDKKFEIRENQIYEFKHNGVYIVCCHYPILEWNRFFHGAIHLYGHVHKGIDMPKGSFNAGVDQNKYFPVDLDWIIQLNNFQKRG